MCLSSRSSLSRERGEKAGDRGDRLERSERGGDRGDRLDRARTPATKRSFSKEVEERSRERPSQPDGLRKAASLTEDRDRGREAGKGPGEGKRRMWVGLGPTSPQTVSLGLQTLFARKTGTDGSVICFSLLSEARSCPPPGESPEGCAL